MNLENSSGMSESGEKIIIDESEVAGERGVGVVVPETKTPTPINPTDSPTMGNPSQDPLTQVQVQGDSPTPTPTTFSNEPNDNSESESETLSSLEPTTSSISSEGQPLQTLDPHTPIPNCENPQVLATPAELLEKQKLVANDSIREEGDISSSSNHTLSEESSSGGVEVRPEVDKSLESADSTLITEAEVEGIKIGPEVRPEPPENLPSFSFQDELTLRPPEEEHASASASASEEPVIEETAGFSGNGSRHPPHSPQTDLLPSRSLLKRRASAMSNGDGEPDGGSGPKKKRSITFDGVTVFYFPRAQGFTCVPSQVSLSLPPLRLAFTQINSRFQSIDVSLSLGLVYTGGCMSLRIQSFEDCHLASANRDSHLLALSDITSGYLLESLQSLFHKVSIHSIKFSYVP